MQASVLSRFRRLAAILLQVVLLVGCGRIVSVEPLSKLSDFHPDTEADGIWVYSKKEVINQDFILIVSSIGSTGQEALWIEHKPGKVLTSARFYLYPTRIGGRRFASIKAAPSAERHPEGKKFENNFTFVTYTVVSDRLKISELNFGAFERGIRSGALKGSIEEEGGGGKWIQLSDLTENIRRFIEENLDKIQNEKDVIEYRRVELKPK